MNCYGYDNALRKRLAQLRVQKGVSAREMSLALGQNTGYISNIESGKTLPSMTGFFYICEYLDISPCDFFDFDTQAPKEASEMMSRLKRLNAVQLNHVAAIVEEHTGVIQQIAASPRSAALLSRKEQRVGGFFQLDNTQVDKVIQ